MLSSCCGHFLQKILSQSSIVFNCKPICEPELTEYTVLSHRKVYLVICLVFTIQWDRNVREILGFCSIFAYSKKAVRCGLIFIKITVLKRRVKGFLFAYFY